MIIHIYIYYIITTPTKLKYINQFYKELLYYKQQQQRTMSTENNKDGINTTKSQAGGGSPFRKLKNPMLETGGIELPKKKKSSHHSFSPRIHRQSSQSPASQKAALTLSKLNFDTQNIINQLSSGKSISRFDEDILTLAKDKLKINESIRFSDILNIIHAEENESKDEILADEEQIRSQRIALVIFTIASVVFFAIIFGLSYWVADLHQQTTVSTNGKLLIKNTHTPVSVASIDYGVNNNQLIDKSTATITTASETTGRRRRLEEGDVVDNNDNNDTNETIILIDQDTDLINVGTQKIDIPLGTLPYLDQEIHSGIDVITVQDKNGWTRTMAITEVILMKNDSMILNGVNGYIVIQDTLAAYAYFDFDKSYKRFCAACSNCGSISVLETPDITELIEAYEEEVDDRGGCSTYLYYINRANEANSSNPFLTYAENKDIDFNYNGNFSNVTDIGDVWDEEPIENDEDDLIDVIGSHNIAIVAGTDEEIEESRRLLLSTRSTKSNLAVVDMETENNMKRKLFTSRLRGVDCNSGDNDDDEKDDETNDESQMDRQLPSTPHHIGRQLKKKKGKKGKKVQKAKKTGKFDKKAKEKKSKKKKKKKKKSSFGKACGKAFKKVGKSVTKIAKKSGVSKWTKKAMTATGDFASDVGEELAKQAKEIGENIEDIANKIANFFGENGCNISPSDMKDTVNMAFSASPDNIVAMKSMYQDVKNLRDGSQAVKGTACTAVWTAVEAANPIASLLVAGITKLVNKCEILKKIGNPAISLGIGLEAGASAGLTRTVESELGIAIDLQGNKMCYFGGCVASGIELPPTPDAGADAGLVFSIWSHPSNIPGSSQTLGLSLSFNLPLGATGVGVEGGVEYIFPVGDITKFYGVSISGEAKVNAPPGDFPAKIGIFSADCNTPVCVKTDGSGCATIDRRRLLQMKNEKTDEELQDMMRYLNDEIMMIEIDETKDMGGEKQQQQLK